MPLRRVVVWGPLIVVLASVALWLWWLKPTPERLSRVPRDVFLLWIEEINTHLLPAMVQPEPVDDPIQLFDDLRRLQVDGLPARPSQDGSHVLAVYRLFDHDQLVATGARLVAAGDLPQDLRLSYRGSQGIRLSPVALSLTGFTPAGSLVLDMDGETAVLLPGDEWNWGRRQDDPRWLSWPAGVGPGSPNRARLEAAMDDGVPITILRLRNLGEWQLHHGGGN